MTSPLCAVCGAAAEEGICDRCYFSVPLNPNLARESEPGFGLLRDLQRRYRIERKLAEGAMGRVWLATDPVLGRRVALKFLKSERASSPKNVARFLREGKILASLHHPEIVTVHDAAHVGDTFVLVMDYVDGEPLDRVLQRKLPPEHLAALIARIARALAYVHERGIVHRDVKPQNIILSRDGRPVLADFGIAKAFDQTSLTDTNAVLGTLAYMPPEQLSAAAEVGPPADIYALGAVLYEGLALRPPFLASNAAALIRKIEREWPAPPCGAPQALWCICQKALEKNPARRYASMQEFAEDLERFVRSEPVRARPPGPLRKLLCGRRIRVGLMAAGVFAGSFAAAALLQSDPQTDRSSEIRRLLDEAKSLRDTQPGRARDYYRAVLRMDPANVEAVEGLEYVLRANHRK